MSNSSAFTPGRTNSVMNAYHWLPTTLANDQFTSFRQPATFFTDHRPNSDLYAYYVNEATAGGLTTSHQLRQFLQQNGQTIRQQIDDTNAIQRNQLAPAGSPNSCSGETSGQLYDGGRPLVNSEGQSQQYIAPCSDGMSCMMTWENTPLPQQGPHCQKPPKGTSNPLSFLN